MRGALIALVALGLALGTSASAQATVFNVIPSDGVDAPVEEFTDQDELWAYTTADISGGLACVVPRPFLLTEEESVPVNCGSSKAWGVTFIPGGTSGIWPISQMSEGLPADLPFQSECSVLITLGCEWQIGIDGTTTRSESFVITRCSAFQCPKRLVPSASTLFKAGKSTAKAALETLCLGFNMLSVAQAASDAKLYTDMLVAEGPNFGVVFTRAELVKEGVGDYIIKLFKNILTPPGVKVTGSAWASASGFILCAPKLDKTFERILGDPPDPNYTAVAAPEYDNLPPPGDALGADLVTALDHLNGDSMALLHAYERYQGADGDGSEPNVHRQARAMSESGFDVLADTRQSIALLRSVATRSESDPDIRNHIFSGDDFDAFDAAFDRVRTSGFTAAEIARFHDAGLTDDEIAVVRDRYSPDLSASGLTPDSTLADALRGLADGLEPTLEPTEALARNASAVAGETNQPPSASFTASPAAPDSRELDFTSTSTSSDGDTLSVRWDFGDGTTGSGATPAHAYDATGTYMVTQTVTDGFESDTTTQAVFAGHANKPPTASFTATPSSGTAPLHVNFDASGSSDPDGSLAAYHWDFGDGGTGDGATVTHTYADAGSFSVSLEVTDDKGLTDTHTAAIKVTQANRAPEPFDDTLDAQGAGALDVLANDSDPDADPLRVVATGAPAHGTASCAALGGCLYTPTAGYAGPDSFTYRVADPAGLEATAHVRVDVTTAPAPSTLLARADRAATRQGTAVTLHVLANDTGTGLHVTHATDPAHGAVDCQDDGDCVYTPGASYSGEDGFSYTVADGDGHERSADVGITVAPATAGYGIQVGGAPAGKTKLVQGQAASWGAGVAPSPAGISEEALAALPRPAMTAELSGAQTLKPPSVRTARGWTADPVTAGARTLHAKAGADALLGEVSDAIPRPLPAIGQGTGGDGHVPILVGSKVFAFFHHSSPTQVTCVDRATGSLCPGYPKTLNQATTEIPGPAVVIGSRIYVHLASQFAVQRVAHALYCWDAAKDRTCGLIVAGRLAGVYAYASAPVLIGGKLYFGGDGGRLYCINPAANAPCAVASLPTGLGPDSSEYDIVADGSRVYLGRLAGLTACIDVTAGGPCSGWALPRQLTGPNLVTHHSAGGAPDGVCSIGQGAGQCYTDAAPAVSIPLTGWPGTEDYYSITAEAELGKRTLMAAHGRGGLGCWDWTAMAPCTGGDYVDGWLDTDTQGQALPMAYGAAYDGSCVVGLGDPGLVFTVDPAGRAPCTSLGAGTEPRTIDLRDQRCDGTVGGAGWQEVALGDSAPGELAAVVVSVRDAGTGALLATKDIAGGKLDLSGIDPKAHPAITVSANAISTLGDPAWTDSVPPRIRVAWKADPRQLCFETATQLECASPLAPIGVTATVDGSAAKDEETLDLVRGACPPKPTATPVGSKPDAGGTLGNTEQPTAADLVRACTSRGVVLEDVIPAGSRVKLLGVAEERFKGRRVDIVFAATGKVVARPKVAPDGSFSATAPLPPRRLRASNRARYQARIGSERSLNLKLMRRMLITSVRPGAGKVTIAGRVVGPLAPRAKDREIVLERRVTCTKLVTVSRVQPRPSGAFKVTAPAPEGASAAVYRLRTKVGVSTHGSRLSSTFTLPRAVGFR